MKFILFVYLLFALLAFCFCEDKEEVLYEVSLIHEDDKKNILLNEWRVLVEEAIRLVKKKNNLKIDELNENHIILWHNNGEKLNEAFFNTEKFKKGNKHVFVYVASELLEEKCLSKENIYRKLGGELEKYKNYFFNLFNAGDKRSAEWIALEEILNLLLKSQELRSILKNIHTDADIELVRLKIIDLTEKKQKYQNFVNVLKENQAILNILKNAEEWNKFVKSNYENLKNLLKSYTEENPVEL